MSATEYLTAVAVAALAAGIASMMAGKDGAGSICKIAGALVLITVSISPIYRQGLPKLEIELPDVSGVQLAADNAAEQTKRLTESAVSSHISGYVVQKALERGIKADVKLVSYTDAEGLLKTEFADVTYADEASYARRDEVSAILSNECGIPAEIQEHIYEKQ